MTPLTDLLDALPDDLSKQVFTHSSWTEKQSDSYTRLAFLGDSVLSLSITTHLYPRLEAEQFGAGRLTKIRAQTVSGASCREVGVRIGLPERLRSAVPEGLPPDAGAKLETERVLASVTEAVIGACYLHAGFDATAAAVVDAFQPELEEALAHPVDFKSTLQERLARRGAIVAYRVDAEHGPPHDRMFDVVAEVDGESIGRGTGRSKKAAEQEAAREALDSITGAKAEAV